MFPVAVHAGAGLWPDVEDVEAEAFTPAPSVEVAGDDAPVHPLTTSSKLAAATVAANRWVVLFNGTNDRVYSGMAG
jgi:hypothetical protein